MSNRRASDGMSSSSRQSIRGLEALASLSESFSATQRAGSISSALSESWFGGEEPEKVISQPNQQEMAKWILMIVGGFTILRTLASALFTIALSILPVGYIYLRFTCPKEETFDPRKELKRVLRGHHLKEEHPDKPKGVFDTMVARATASVSAETAVWTPGTQVQLTPILDIFIVAKLAVPQKEMVIYWLGIAGEWRYIHTRQIVESKKTT